MNEKLTAKLEEIRRQIEQQIATLNALKGAEQILLQLIEENKDVVEDENSNG